MTLKSKMHGRRRGSELRSTQGTPLELIHGGRSGEPSAERLDPRVLEKLFSIGGERLVFQLLDLFAGTAPARIEAIRRGIQSGDLEDIERQAHALKSSAGNLGAKRMAALCQSIEATSCTARRGDAAERSAALRAIGDRTQALQQEMARVGPHFAELRAKGRG